MCARANGCAGAIHADRPRLPHAEQHAVDAATLADALFVTPTEVVDVVLVDESVGAVDVALGDVDMVKEDLAQEVHVAVCLVRERIELVDEEDDHVAQAESLLAVHTDQLSEDGVRRPSARHGQNKLFALALAFADAGSQFAGQLSSALLHGGVDMRPDLLESGQEAVFIGVLRFVILLRDACQGNL